MKFDTEKLELLFKSIELGIKIILSRVEELEKRIAQLEDK